MRRLHEDEDDGKELRALLAVLYSLAPREPSDGTMPHGGGDDAGDDDAEEESVHIIEAGDWCLRVRFDGFREEDGRMLMVWRCDEADD